TRHAPDSRTGRLHASTRQIKERRSPSPREHETNISGIVVLAPGRRRGGSLSPLQATGTGVITWQAAGAGTRTGAVPTRKAVLRRSVRDSTPRTCVSAPARPYRPQHPTSLLS